MNMIIVFSVVFVVVGGLGFFFGIRNGKKRSRKAWENEIRYVTIGDIENMAAEMRAKGASDDAVFVIVKPDWWEAEK